MSKGFVKWLKITAVLYAVFFWGGVVMRNEKLVMYMLALLAGLAIFVAWRMLVMTAGGFKRVVWAIKDLMNTRYVIVFKF